MILEICGSLIGLVRLIDDVDRHVGER